MRVKECTFKTPSYIEASTYLVPGASTYVDACSATENSHWRMKKKQRTGLETANNFRMAFHGTVFSVTHYENGGDGKVPSRYSRT